MSHRVQPRTQVVFPSLVFVHFCVQQTSKLTEAIFTVHSNSPQRFALDLLMSTTLACARGVISFRVFQVSYASTIARFLRSTSTSRLPSRRLFCRLQPCKQDPFDDVIIKADRQIKPSQCITDKKKLFPKLLFSLQYL